MRCQESVVMSGQNENGVIVPYQNLSDDALQGLIEEYASRDHGYCELTMGQRAAQVKRRLQHGEAVIVFDTKTETANIVSTDERNKDASASESDKKTI